MRILALESSARPASVALWEDGELRASFTEDCGLTHSKTLTGLCEALFTSSGILPEDVDYIAVSAGPGSFTGVRIGISVCKGMAFASGIPCITVSSLEALAYGAHGFFEGALLCPCVDARVGRVYTASFRVRGGAVIRKSKDRIEDTEELAQSLPDRAVLLGDGAEAVLAAGEAVGKHFRRVPIPLCLQNGWGVALAAAQKTDSAVSGEVISPVYLQKSQAERNLSAKKAN